LFTFKCLIMFYKKRQRVASAWWSALNRKQNLYARRLADWLGRKTVNIPTDRLRIYMILLLMSLGGLELWVGIYSIRHADRVAPYGRPVRVMTMPPPHRAQGSGFTRFVDSLRHDRVFDSLLQARPGLSDTIRRLEDWER